MSTDLTKRLRLEAGTSTSTSSGAESKHGYSAGTADGALLLDALTCLWEQTRHQGETCKERAIETYAERLAGFHSRAVLRVLDDWPNHDDWWPPLHALVERLPPEDWRPDRTQLPPPSQDGQSRGSRLLEGAANLERRVYAKYAVLPPNIVREISQMRERAREMGAPGP